MTCKTDFTFLYACSNCLSSLVHSEQFFYYLIISL